MLKFTLTFFILSATAAAAAAPLEVNRALSQLTTTLNHSLPVNACAVTLARWNQAFGGPKAVTEGASDTPADLLQRMFDLRQNLRAHLSKWPHAPEACVDQVRKTLTTLRGAEDQLALATRGEDPAPTSLTGEPAWLTTADGAGEVKLRSGDVLLSRGNAFVSAAIAKIGEVKGDFSHLAQVYIDAPAGTEIGVHAAASDPRVFTIEAHIEVGSFTRPFRDYVADGNARVAQFRPSQSAVNAHHAAWAIYDWVKRWQRAHADAFRRAEPNVNDNPPYDFKMNLADAGEVFCAEIVSIAQATVGWRVPMYPTRLKTNELTRTMGIVTKTTFAPSDLEVDPRFRQLAEWRDLDKLGSILKKDVVFAHVYAEMKAGRLKLTPTPEDYAKAVFAWTVRQNDLGLMTKLPKNMGPAIIALTFVIDRIGATFLQRLIPVVPPSADVPPSGVR